MSENNETQLVWQKIKGSEKLYEVYKYYPTLHDACAIEVNCSFEKREVCITFYYSDMVGKDINKIVSTLITICWQNIIKADFSIDGNDIYRLDLKFDNGLFETMLGHYFNGLILCKEVEVSEVIIEPDISNWEERAIYTTKFSLK